MSRYPGLTLRVMGAGSPAIGPGKAALVEQIGRASCRERVYARV